jgi:hypothetical protein
LPPDAKAEVCAELARLRAVFAQELEAAARMRVMPGVMNAFVRVVGDFVRQAKARGPRKTAGAARSRAREQASRRVGSVQTHLRGFLAALRRLQDADRLLSHEVAGFHWTLEESLLGEALQAHAEQSGVDIYAGSVLGEAAALTATFERLLADFEQKLASWTPSSHQPLWRKLVDRLVRLYEQTSHEQATADWSNRGAKPTGPFSRLLVVIYDALPEAARQHASATRAQFVENAKELIGELRMAEDGGA